MVLALVSIVAATSVPALTTGRDRARTYAAARLVATKLMRVRAQALSGGAMVALHLGPAAGDVELTTVVDGNHNGVRAVDLRDGVDTRLGPTDRLGHLFPGISVDGLAASGAWFSFSPLGTSSSGTVYLTGAGGARFAVRVLGATGRVRMLRFDEASRTWTGIYQ